MCIRDRYPITVIDNTKIVNIPVKRTAFGKRTNDIKIQDGLIIDNHIVNPSSAEGFVSIPIDIAKAIVSIPAQIIKVKIDNTTKLKDLEDKNLQLEKAILDSQLFEENQENKIDNELLKIKLDKLTRASNELKIIDVETKLAEAEKNGAEKQKLLEEAYKLIEELRKEQP